MFSAKINTIKSLLVKNNPPKQKDIFDDFNKSIIEELTRVDIYYKAARPQSLFSIGHWVIELVKKDDTLIIINMPHEMTELELIHYIKPLKNLLETPILTIDPHLHEVGNCNCP